MVFSEGFVTAKPIYQPNTRLLALPFSYEILVTFKFNNNKLLDRFD